MGGWVCGWMGGEVCGWVVGAGRGRAASGRGPVPRHLAVARSWETGCWGAEDAVPLLALLPPNCLAVPLLAATHICLLPGKAASPDSSPSQVSRLGDTLLKKRTGVDSPKPAVDLEAAAVVLPLFALFLGGPGAVCDGGLLRGGLGTEQHPEAAAGAAAALAPGGEDVREPASAALRGRILGLLCKSLAAASVFPQAVDAIAACLWGSGGPSTGPRLRQQGMEWAVWTFRHAAPERLAPLAPQLLQACLRLLDDGGAAGAQDAAALGLRSFAYQAGSERRAAAAAAPAADGPTALAGQPPPCASPLPSPARLPPQAIGQLAQRCPAAFSSRPEVAERFFQALATEPPGVRAAVQESTTALAQAFRGAGGEAGAAVQALLLRTVTSPEEAVRGAAVQWAVRLYPFAHAPARYICILAAGDVRYSIAEAGLAGLQPPAPRGGGGGTAPSPSSAAAGAEAACARGAENHPSLGTMLRYLCARHPALAVLVEEGGALALPPRAFMAAISFLEDCRRSQAQGERRGQQHAAPGAAAGAEPGADAEADAEAEAEAASYLLLLGGALVRAAPAELHAAALDATLALAAERPAALAAFYAAGPGPLMRLLGHVDVRARHAAAQLLGLLAPHQPAAAAAALEEQLLATLAAAAGGGGGGGRRPRLEEADGAAAALGYLAARHYVRGSEPADEAPLLRTMAALRQLLGSAGASAAAGPAPVAAAEATAAQGQQKQGPGSGSGEENEKEGALRAGASAASLRATAAVALGHACLPLAQPRAPDAPPLCSPLERGVPEAGPLVAAAAALLEEREPQVVKRAAQALGLLCWALAALLRRRTETQGAGGTAAAASPEAAALRAAANSLLGLRSRRREETVLFAAGEALCLAFGGVALLPSDVFRSRYEGLAARQVVAQRGGGGGGGASAHDEASAAARAAAAAESAAVDAAGVQQLLLDAILNDYLMSTRAEVSGAVCCCCHCCSSKRPASFHADTRLPLVHAGPLCWRRLAGVAALVHRPPPAPASAAAAGETHAPAGTLS